MICSNCGQPLQEGKLFCGNCGHLNSGNSQPQQALKALEIAKTSRFDLFVLGWAALISFALGRYFMFLPEISRGNGNYFAPMGIPLPGLRNNFGSNLAFFGIVALNLLCVMFVLKNNNFLKKYVALVLGTILLILSPFSLFIASVLRLGRFWELPVIVLSASIFYMGIIILSLAKISRQEPRYAKSMIAGMAGGVIVALLIQIFANRTNFIYGFGEIVVNSLGILALAVFTITRPGHAVEANGETGMLQGRNRLFFIGLYFLPLVANILVGYLFYLGHYY